jgi:hypothetical protein
MDDSNAPATKGDIHQLRTEMSHQYNDLVERIADTETKLLQAFYTYRGIEPEARGSHRDGQRRTQEPAFNPRRTPHRR